MLKILPRGRGYGVSGTLRGEQSAPGADITDVSAAIRLIRYMPCVFRIAEHFSHFEGVGQCFFTQATASVSYDIVAFLGQSSRLRRRDTSGDAVAMLRSPTREREWDRSGIVCDGLSV